MICMFVHVQIYLRVWASPWLDAHAVLRSHAFDSDSYTGTLTRSKGKPDLNISTYKHWWSVSLGDCPANGASSYRIVTLWLKPNSSTRTRRQQSELDRANKSNANKLAWIIPQVR